MGRSKLSHEDVVVVTSYRSVELQMSLGVLAHDTVGCRCDLSGLATRF